MRQLSRVFSLTRTERYGIAVLGVAIAALLRLAVDPVLRDDLPLFLFFFPIVAAAWAGGLGPGLLATALSLVVGDYLFIEPRGSVFHLESEWARSRLLLLGSTSTLFCLLLERLRKAIRGQLECLEGFGLMIDAVEDYAIFALDPEGKVASWNPGAQRITGYRKREVIGRPLSIFYPQEDVTRGRPGQDLGMARSEKHFEEEGWLVRKDGSRFWASGVIVPLHHPTGELRGYAKVMRDMTVRRQADELLSERSDFSQRLVDVSPSTIYVYDVRQSRIVFSNRDASASIGYDPLSDPDFMSLLRERMHPDDWPFFVSHLKKLATLKDDRTIECEYRLRSKTGEWRRIHNRDKVFTRDENGAVLQTIGAATDITEFKALEEKSRFMASMNEALMPLSDPKEIMTVAVRMLGEYLQADRCAYAETTAGEDAFVVLNEYARGVAKGVTPRLRLSGLGERACELLRGNRPVIVSDTETESPDGLDLSLYRKAGVRALACVPLRKSGNFVAAIEAQQNSPRVWTGEEVRLLRTVANRCWESVERARVLGRLKDSEDRYRAFIANSTEGIWRYEIQPPIPLSLPPGEQLALLYTRAYLAECNDAMARMYGYENAAEILGSRLDQLLFPSDENVAKLQAFNRDGYRLSDVETREVDRYGVTRYFLNNMVGMAENGAIVRAWGTQRDITEEKRAAETMRASEVRLRRITDATQDVLWEIDVKANHLWWSEAAKPLFGHSPGELQIRMDDWYAAIHPDDRNRVREKFTAFMANRETSWSDEYRFLRADGVYVDIEDKGEKFYDDNGNATFIAGAMVDITERKAAETALRESEERFEKAFRASPDALVISRIADGVILELNDSFAAMTGYDRSELLGKSTIDLDLYVDPTDRERAVRILREQHSVRDLEFPMRHRSGAIRYVSFSAQLLTLRGEECWLTMGRDITLRKQAEEATHKSDEEARRQLAYVEAIYATAPVGLCFVDTDLRFRSINQHLAEIDGKTIEEHLGHTLREIVPDLAPTIEPKYRYVIETGQPVLDFEVSKPAGKDADAQHFIASYYPIADRFGRVVGVNVVVVDITQRKQVEEERERLLQKEKTAREDAEAASRLKDEFLATISHELRTPLTAILGWAHLLTTGSLSEAKGRHAIEVIEQSAKSQARLVDDILDTSRIITGRFQFDARPVDLERVFQAALEVIRPSAEAKRIDLRAVIGREDKIVFGDANRLQQVIWNLLSNAVKFTGEGGHIEAGLIRSGNQIEITVADSGIGMEPMFLPYVFDRFRQADSTPTRRYGGLGLGLAIVRHVVEMHGGSVAASSAGKGKGSTFTVRFPAISTGTLAPPSSRSSEPNAPSLNERQRATAASRLDGVRVLVVEDDKATLEMLRFALADAGAEVIPASSPREALQTLDRRLPHVLISDLAMPGEDGFDLIARVRGRPPERGGKIPAVALSAYARPEDSARARAAGFQLHLCKPIDPDALVDVVAELAGKLQSH